VAIQYTFTHKHYAEYGDWNIHNYKTNWEVRTVPWHCLTTEEKAPKTRIVNIFVTEFYNLTIYLYRHDTGSCMLLISTLLCFSRRSGFKSRTWAWLYNWGIFVFLLILSDSYTLQNHDLFTILHSDDMHSERLTDHCEYHRYARLTSVSFCRCASSCFMARIFSPETKSKP
jgi:hypothetical protein